MNKKILGLGALGLAIFTLSGCKNETKEDYNTWRQESEISSEDKTFFGLDFDATTGTRLGDSTATGSYYAIYSSPVESNQFFVYNYDLSTYFNSENGKNNKTATVNALVFENLMYATEREELFKTVTSVIDQAYETTFEFNCSEISKTISTEAAYNKYVEIKDANETVYLSTVYAPVFMEHIYKDDKSLSQYVFVPVYVTFTTSTGLEIGQEKNTISGYKTLAIADYLSNQKLKNALNDPEEK